jgi:hypothetical protein
MSLKIRFRFDGECSRYPRYNPKRDGRPGDGKRDGCESLYVIHLYTRIAQKRARSSSGVEAQVCIGTGDPYENRAPGGGQLLVLACIE